MTKTEFLDRCARTGEERLLLSRVLDKAERSRSRSVPEHTAFLSPAEQVAVQDTLKLYGDVRYVLAGGYPGAERAVCLFLPDWMEAEYLEPDADGTLAAVEAELNPSAKLGHRDVLGSLMGVGVTRELLGDILITPEKAQCMVLRSALDIVLSQWDSVGRFSVSPREISLAALEVREPELRAVNDTVATLRLDSVLATGFSISRAKAADLIAAGRVAVNHRDCVKADKQVCEGDILTCRGLGKCVLREANAKSKKGRIIVRMERYI
ncbi:MAG: RNA-binding protein [Candidatus Heteroscillospira sp.]|jgi:RNA-binding protein YlmH